MGRSLPAKAGTFVAAAGVSSLLAIAGGPIAGALSSSDQGNQPPGNNGTIKIHRSDTDPEVHANEPHVGCEFNVEFFGFDGYANTSTMTFELWSPTGVDEPDLYTRHVDLTVADRVNGAEWDHEESFTATQIIGTNDVTPHDQQGYHVKLTVETNDSADNGAIVKHKVFWMQPCEVGTSNTTTTTTRRGGTTTTTAGGGTTTTTAGRGASTTTLRIGGSSETTVGASVLGESITRTETPAAARPQVQGQVAAQQEQPQQAQVLGTHLARTGLPLGLLAGSGGALIAAGYALTRGGRRNEESAGS